MNEHIEQVIIVGGGPLALLTALMLKRLGIVVIMAGEPPPVNPPLTPELMLIGGDETLPGLFQISLEHWRNASETLLLPNLLISTPAQDLATSPGRTEKLRSEAMLDALGGEPVTFIPEASPFAPRTEGYKKWDEAPMLVPDTLHILQKAADDRGIPRIAVNPLALQVTDPLRPQITLEDGRVLQGNAVVFTSARSLRRLLPPLGLALPLRPARGHIIHLQTFQPHGLPLMLQRLQRGHLFIVPVGPNLVDIHYDAINDPAQSTFNTQHSASLVTALIQHCATLVPTLGRSALLGVDTARNWLTPDFLPAIGFWPGLPGVLVGTGWGGRSTAYAAGAAATLVECIMQGNPSLNIQPLAPNRFASGLWQVVKQPGSLDWQEPTTETPPPSLMSVKPDYAENVHMVETPKAQYATTVNQVGKTITETAGRRPAVQTKSKPKITTASVK